MDQLIAAAEPKQRGNLGAVPTHDACSLGIRVGRDAARDFHARGTEHTDRIARLEAPQRAGDSGGQQALAGLQGTQGSCVHMDGARRTQRAGNPLLARGHRRGCRQKPGAARTGLDALERMRVRAGGDAHVAARTDRNARGGNLGRHATRAHIGGRAPRHRFDLRCDVRHAGDELRRGIAIGVGAVQPVDIREQHQAIGTGHLRDPRGQAVVVAVADLSRRYRVILVDYRYRAQAQERFERGACVQVAGALLAVFQGQQYLSHRDLVRLEQLLIGMRQADLSDRSGGLTLLQAQRAGRQSQMPPPQRDGAGRHQDQLAAAPAQPQQVFHQGFQPAAVEPAGTRIDQQGGADLDDHATRLVQGPLYAFGCTASRRLARRLPGCLAGGHGQ